jgi:hypothetical protein
MAHQAPDFLTITLGQQGADALRKACRRDEFLEPILLPRAILGWLSMQEQFEGSIPGCDNSYLVFKKTEQDTFTGSVSLPDVDGLLDFHGSSLSQMAATVATALGLQVQAADARLRDQVVSVLGKHVDSLLRTQIEVQELRKSRLGPQVVSEHGHYRVEKSEDGYAVVAKSGGVVKAGFGRLRDAADHADRQQTMWGGSFRKDLSKKELDPGAGYRISHEQHDAPGLSSLTVTAHGPNGQQVGIAKLIHGANTGNVLKPGYVVVDEDHRRRGLATAMYQHAERVLGKKINPGSIQTDEGSALWAQPNRPFGKGEQSMDKAGGQEGPGQPAPPQAPEGPRGPMGFQSKKQQKRRLPSLGLNKSEAQVACKRCGGRQFQGTRFRGCMCFASLAKSITTSAYRDGFVLDFADDIDPDEARALILNFKRDALHG